MEVIAGSGLQRLRWTGIRSAGRFPNDKTLGSQVAAGAPDDAELSGCSGLNCR